LKSDNFYQTLALTTQKILKFTTIYAPFWEQKIYKHAGRINSQH